VTHSIEQMQDKRRGASTNFRLAAHYLELHDDERAVHHAELACEDMKVIKLETIEAASGACEVE